MNYRPIKSAKTRAINIAIPPAVMTEEKEPSVLTYYVATTLTAMFITTVMIAWAVLQ